MKINLSPDPDETCQCYRCKKYFKYNEVDRCPDCEELICDGCYDEHINGKNYAFKAGE